MDESTVTVRRSAIAHARAHLAQVSRDLGQGEGRAASRRLAYVRTLLDRLGGYLPGEEPANAPALDDEPALPDDTRRAILTWLASDDGRAALLDGMSAILSQRIELDIARALRMLLSRATATLDDMSTF